MIRKLTKDDMPQMRVYAKYFWDKTPYVTTGMEIDLDAVESLLWYMKNEHYLRVLEEDGNIVGFIGVIIAPLDYNPAYIAGQEKFFFVHPEYRDGRGKDLLEQAEKDLKEIGVHLLAMGDMTTSKDMDKYYTREGYMYTERTYTKVI